MTVRSLPEWPRESRQNPAPPQPFKRLRTMIRRHVEAVAEHGFQTSKSGCAERARPGLLGPSPIASPGGSCAPCRWTHSPVIFLRRRGWSPPPVPAVPTPTPSHNWSEEPRTARRRRLAPEHLSRVAKAYTEALARGEHPTEAVRHEFGKSRATAERYVSAARASRPPDRSFTPRPHPSEGLPMSRRDNHQGSLSQRRDGRWQGSIRYTDATGRARRAYLYGRTKTDVRQRWRRLSPCRGRPKRARRRQHVCRVRRGLGGRAACGLRPQGHHPRVVCHAVARKRGAASRDHASGPSAALPYRGAAGHPARRRQITVNGPPASTPSSGRYSTWRFATGSWPPTQPEWWPVHGWTSSQRG